MFLEIKKIVLLSKNVGNFLNGCVYYVFVPLYECLKQ